MVIFWDIRDNVLTLHTEYNYAGDVLWATKGTELALQAR